MTVLQDKSEIFCSQLKYVLQNISQVCSTTRNALQACNIATFRKITFSASFCNTFFAFENCAFCNYSDHLSLQTTTLIGLLKTARLLRLVRVARKIGTLVWQVPMVMFWMVVGGEFVRLYPISISNVSIRLFQTNILNILLHQTDILNMERLCWSFSCLLLHWSPTGLRASGKIILIKIRIRLYKLKRNKKKPN